MYYLRTVYSLTARLHSVHRPRTPSWVSFDYGNFLERPNGRLAPQMRTIKRNCCSAETAPSKLKSPRIRMRKRLLVWIGAHPSSAHTMNTSRVDTNAIISSAHARGALLICASASPFYRATSVFVERTHLKSASEQNDACLCSMRFRCMPCMSAKANAQMRR